MHNADGSSCGECAHPLSCVHEATTFMAVMIVICPYTKNIGEFKNTEEGTEVKMALKAVQIRKVTMRMVFSKFSVNFRSCVSNRIIL